jgi:hypothetical protein
MTLHQFDLNYCQQALDALMILDGHSQPIYAEALWIASIARYFKCFGENKSRTQLSAK